MAQQTSSTEPQQRVAQRRNSRRNFLRTAGGVAAGTAFFVAGCDGDSVPANNEPTGTLSADPTMVEPGEPVTFTVGLSDDDGDDLDAVLRFGDGVSEPVDDGDTVTHVYDREDVYTAELRVRDDFSGFEDGGMATITVVVGPPPPIALDFSNDFGVLNYAYALEQLEAAFYAETVRQIRTTNLNFPGDSDGAIEDYFRDLAAHEAIHRDFLAEALGNNAIRTITPGELDFGIDFTDANQVLNTAQALEDTGVSAYNGAGILLEDPGFLTIAGKIVSVEARHAAAIRATIDPGSQNFADLTDLTDLGADPDDALDVALAPADVVPLVQPFILPEIQATGL